MAYLCACAHVGLFEGRDGSILCAVCATTEEVTEHVRTLGALVNEAHARADKAEAEAARLTADLTALRGAVHALRRVTDHYEAHLAQAALFRLVPVEASDGLHLR